MINNHFLNQNNLKHKISITFYTVFAFDLLFLTATLNENYNSTQA
jgi:hypothetical protein